jgi:long-chain acyl-CoA synthetase
VSQWHEDLISVEDAGTLDGLFVRRVRRSPDTEAYRTFDRASQTWVSYTWRDMARQVARWQRALEREALSPGDRVAIQLRNCPEWVTFDQAALSLGLVTVPLYTDDRPDSIDYILEDAAVKLLLVQDASRWKRLAPIMPEDEDANLQRVLLLDESAEAAKFARHDERVRLVADWLPRDGGELTERRGNPHDLASIVYTSGTTGRPKGVMLSHHNMLWVAHASLTIIDCYSQDVFLSFLPLSHTFERTGGYYVPMMAGAAVAYARSVGQLGEDLQTVKPTVLVAVPRIFERVYGRIEDQMEKKPAFAKALFHLAVKVGWHRFLHQQGRGGIKASFLLWPLLNRLVAHKIVARLGGRLRIAVSGGAPLSPEIAKVFIGLGVPIIQGYGLTETSPVISANPLQDNEPASVGVPLRGIHVRIGVDDELQVKSPGNMLGYWNNHSATKQVIDPDGWLHTGDQARIERGHIYITGRLKDILVLSNGEKVPPADMEMAIGLDPLFDQVMVVGEGRPYLTALLVLNPDHWRPFAASLGVNPDDGAQLKSDRVLGAVLTRVRNALRDFPGYAKIRRVSLSLDGWTVDNGLMTPTLKIKRPKVLEYCADCVEGMYAGGPAD